ncbi:MAG TPA: hypothetical protein DCY27_01835 [Desulfobacterales bacterium]|nr:hypothetical protein [Desulfobacterales bacterium]
MMAKLQQQGKIMADRGVEIQEQDIDMGIRLYIRPVTLRQIEVAGIMLDSEFGCDENEHGELLDDRSIVRVAVEVVCGINEDDGQIFASDVWSIETLSGTLSHPNPQWTICSIPPVMTHGEKGLRQRERELVANDDRISQMAYEIFPGLAEYISTLKNKFEIEMIEIAGEWGLVECPHCESYTNQDEETCQYCDSDLEEEDDESELEEDEIA